MMPDDPNATEDRADNTIIPSEPLADAAQVSQDADVVTPQDADRTVIQALKKRPSLRRNWLAFRTSLPSVASISGVCWEP